LGWSIIVWVVGRVVRQSRLNESQYARHRVFGCCLHCIHGVSQRSKEQVTRRAKRNYV